jgi:hypothetical protein
MRRGLGAGQECSIRLIAIRNRRSTLEEMSGGRSDQTRSAPIGRTPNPLPLHRPEGFLEFPELAIHAAEFLKITLSWVTHNPKVGGSNPPPLSWVSFRNLTLDRARTMRWQLMPTNELPGRCGHKSAGIR